MGRAGGGGRGGGFSGGSRGGSFGGSRGGSFGGGGYSGRSSTGRSYSSGNSRPRTSGGYGYNGYGGYWGTPRMSGPVIINNSGNRNYNSPDNNGNYPNKHNGNSGNSGNNTNHNSIGCLHIALICIIVFSLIVLLFNSITILGNDKKERTKLNANVNETAYYTDELGWIDNSAALKEGMKYFYEKTGVQPYLYITDNVGGSFYDYAENFANSKYDQLFTDEAHILLIFHEKDDWYNTYCLAGSSADTVIDSEARMILLDTIDEYYYDSSLDDNEFFSKSFKVAADKIMKKSSSNISAVIIPLFIFVSALAVEISVINKAKKEKREKELKEMLEKPLETFGSTEAAELAKKYETDTTDTEISASDKTDNICSNCKNQLESDSNFCSKCGKKIEK